MADANSTTKQIINGFPCVTRLDVINNADVVMEYIWKMRSLFASIELLGHECCEVASGRTPEGKARAIAAMRAGYSRWRMEQHFTL